MKNQTVFLGIDIGKTQIDICVNRNGEEQLLTVKNTIESIENFFFKNFSCEKLVIGMEHTGRCNWAILTVLSNCAHKVFVVSPLHLSKSLGLVRGKSDKLDSIRIANFVKKNHLELRPWKPKRKVINELSVLLCERRRLKKMKGQTQRGSQDASLIKNSTIIDSILEINKDLVCVLKEKIKLIDNTIKSLIRQDEQLLKMAKLLKSVIGIGDVLCWNLICKTNEFITINTPRKLACYAGVVPYEHSSGTSVRGKRRVSSYADKQLKTILHLAAMSAIRYEGELRSYYLRKVESGKNKMSVINAIRNKIIHRAYAVIKNQKPYQNYLELS